ncbi:MAG: SRPBCC family protein [Myxococcota bacterium]|nr:SRPBCC family protein [Myxococcota bacterium]
MKWLKRILVVILAVVVLVLIAGLIVPQEYAVAREITIDKPQAVVFNYVKYLKNQDNFSVWAKMDPNMKKTFKGQDGQVGFVSAWDSQHQEVGKGEQEIKKITENQRVDFELRFLEPFEATDQAYMATDSLGANQTKVTWGFNGAMPYPMNLMLLAMDMDTMLGDQLAQGLENLKGLLERD